MRKQQLSAKNDKNLYESNSLLEKGFYIDTTTNLFNETETKTCTSHHIRETY